jgi:HEAT repeat protein
MLDISNPQASDSATALASIQDKRTITYFAEALRKFGDFGSLNSAKGEYRIEARAIAALATYDDDRALEALRSAMNSQSEDIRYHVATAFEDSPHRSALTLLLKMQNDHYWFVRVRVADGLRKLKTKEAQAALQKLLKDGVKEVREEAQRSLN